ncbi:MAG: hypothetical protein EBS35_03100 [Bacteroidetes bacterium]|nr:hypothetical protein [Bacteroidota bacterium]
MVEKTSFHEDNIFSLLLPKDEKNIIFLNPATYTEEELLNLLSEQIKYLMVHDKEHLWSLFYRLDISDESLRNVLMNKDDENHAGKLAQLVLDRQKKRMHYKSTYKQPLIEDDEWLTW